VPVVCEQAAMFFNNEKSGLKREMATIRPITFALDAEKQGQLAEKPVSSSGRFGAEPRTWTQKNQMAMTYLSSGNPMQGITICARY